VTREQLANVLRAASRIAEVRDVVVIGSQSVAKRSPSADCHTPPVSSAGMQSPARDLVDHTQRRRFGDAFSGGAGLTDSGRSFLLKKLGTKTTPGEATTCCR